MTIKTMQDIKSKKLRDRISNETRRYVSRFEPLLNIPAFTQKDFHYVHTRPSTKGPPPRNYKYKPRVHNFNSLSTATQEGIHKVKKITTW